MIYENKEPFLSVSIPVYNAVKYLEQCIESIINQTEIDFELILVDDGSTDGSLELCKKYEEQYGDIVRVIEKRNEGSLLTRRRCLQESKGQYFYLMDADDYLISRDALKQIRNRIEETKCDLLFFNVTTTSDNVPYLRYPFSDDELFENDELVRIYELICKGDEFNSLWNKVFKRDLVDWDQDYFCYGHVTNGTDMFQMLPIAFNSRRIAYLNKNLYFYRLNDNSSSIIHSFKKTIYQSLKENFLRLKFYVTQNEKCCEKLRKDISNRYIIFATTSAYKVRLLEKNKKKEGIDYLRTICEDELFAEEYHHAKMEKISLGRRCLVFLMKKKYYKIIWFITHLSQ